MFTEIACNIIKVTDDTMSDIEAAEFNLKGKKANLDLAQKEYANAEESLHTAKMAQYNARKKVVRDYIDNVLMNMQAPETYDPDRVKKLRGILASYGEKDTYAKRLEILTAIRELQLILTAFPIARRVGNIVREWTGSKNVVISKDGSTVSVGKNVVMRTMEQLDQSDSFMASICREYKYRHLLQFYGSEAHYSGTPMGHIHDFWESRCLALPLDPDIVIGEVPSVEHDSKLSKRFHAFNECKDTGKYSIRDIGTELFKVDERRFSGSVAMLAKCDPSVAKSTVSDIDWASNVIVLNPCLFSVNEVMSNYGRFTQAHYKGCTDMYHNSKSHLDFYIDRITEKLQECAPKTVKDIKFDADLMAVTWRDPYDKDMAFDPDTCEMQHPSQTVHKLDVRNVKMYYVAMYAYKHIPGMKKPDEV